MKCFAIRFNALEGRLDPFFYKKEFNLLRAKLVQSKFKTVSLGSLLDELYRYPTFYDIEYKKVGIPVLKISNINKLNLLQDFTIENYDFIDEGISNKFPRTKLKNDNLVMAVRGATIGKTAVVTKCFENANINANLIRLSVKENLIKPYFLWVYLTSSLGQKILLQNVANTAKQTITVPQIKSTPVPLPPIEFQGKIEKLVSNAFEKQKQNLQQAKALLASIDEYVLSELGIKLPVLRDKTCFTVKASQVQNSRIDAHYYQPKFEEVTKAILKTKYNILILKNIYSFITSGKRPKGGVRGSSEGIPSIGGEHVFDNGSIATTGLKYIPVNFHKNNLKSKLHVNDILIVKDGATTGKVGIVPPDYPYNEANINEHLFLLRIKKDYNPYYVFALLKSIIGQIQIKREISGGTIMGIIKDSIDNTPIPIPPLGIQQKIADEIKSRMDKAKQLQIEARQTIEQAKKEAEKMILGEK